MKRIAFRMVLLGIGVLAGMQLAATLEAQEPGKTLPETLAPVPAAQAATPLVPTAAPSPAKPALRPPPQNPDWAQLARFKDANAAISAPAAGEMRVVFMGDSITQGWKIDGPDGSFPGKPYLNRGISGQTTPQMLLRFRQDVIDLKPKVVVILAGINDIAGNTGPMTLEQTEGNLMSMAELATANGIKVVMCSVLPALDFPWRPGQTPAPKVIAINAWMKSYAEEKGYVYVDYYSAMKDEQGGLPAALSKDGVHPLQAGYAIMAPLAEAGIEKALKAGAGE